MLFNLNVDISRALIFSEHILTFMIRTLSQTVKYCSKLALQSLKAVTLN